MSYEKDPFKNTLPCVYEYIFYYPIYIHHDSSAKKQRNMECHLITAILENINQIGNINIQKLWEWQWYEECNLRNQKYSYDDALFCTLHWEDKILKQQTSVWSMMGTIQNSVLLCKSDTTTMTKPIFELKWVTVWNFI